MYVLLNVDLFQQKFSNGIFVMKPKLFKDNMKNFQMVDQMPWFNDLIVVLIYVITAKRAKLK